MKGLICFVWGGLLVALVFAFLVAGSTSAAPGLVPCTVESDGSGTHPTIQAAVNDAACDPITIGPGVFVQNVTIDRTVTVQGQGPADTWIDGNASSPVFTIQTTEGETVTLAEMTITDGAADNGAGILNSGYQLTVTHCSLIENAAAFHGGAIDNGGSLTVIQSSFISNTADAGGGIFNAGTLFVSGGWFTGNHASFHGGGIFNDAVDYNATVIDSTFGENSAALWGGAIVNDISATLVISSSTFSTNTAAYGGAIRNYDGAVTVWGGTFSGNMAQDGAGIFNDENATLAVTASILSHNSASASGGGINSAGAATVSQCSFISNTAVVGGGIRNYGGMLTVNNSTFSENTADAGGGIFNIMAGGEALVANSTLSGNSAAVGGGILNGPLATLTVTNSTLSDNMSETGGGIFNDVDGLAAVLNTTISDNTSNGAGSGITNRGTMELASSIVADSPLGQDCEVESGAVLTSLGYNIDSDGTCNLTEPTDQPNTDPLLGPLQDNGGPTWTHALAGESPAVDQGSCPGVTADQRGYPRPVDLAGIANADDGCDVGAYELQEPAVYLPVVYRP